MLIISYHITSNHFKINNYLKLTLETCIIDTSIFFVTVKAAMNSIALIESQMLIVVV